METHELVVEMKLLERRLTLYEEKYGILSEDFYAALMSGKLARYDEYDETRADFSRWKGIFETWKRRRQSYAVQIEKRAPWTSCVCSRPIDDITNTFRPRSSATGFQRRISALRARIYLR